ncbi:MAG: hypothetical protein AAGA56_28890, partial [Myxococcota bacterium]
LLQPVYPPIDSSLHELSLAGPSDKHLALGLKRNGNEGTWSLAMAQRESKSRATEAGSAGLASWSLASLASETIAGLTHV